MGGGLTFLSKKGFNPANIQNQKNVWEARQRVKQAQEESEKRSLQLKQEREEDELAKSRYGNNQLSHKHSTLKFMYNVPPGLEKAKSDNSKIQLDSVEDRSNNVSNYQSDFQSETTFEPQPGDDEAAAQFRLLLSNQLNPNERFDHENLQSEPSSNSTSNHIDNDSNDKDEIKKDNVDTRTHLEKAVGKAASQSQAISLEMQIARFPQLKNAPVVKGMNPSNINVQFKPMGAQPIRHIKCLKCGVWGHSRGDRECKLSGWDPFHAKFVTDKNHAPEQINSNDGVRDGVGNAHGKHGETADKDRKKRRTKKHDKYYKKSSRYDDDDDMSSCTETSVSSSSHSSRSYGGKKYDRREKNKKRLKHELKKHTRHRSHRHQRRDRGRNRDRNGDRDRGRDKDSKRRTKDNHYKHENKKRKRGDPRDRGKELHYCNEDTRKERKVDARKIDRM